MRLEWFIGMVIGWFILVAILLALAIRAYAIRVRITYPVRKVITMTDYQDIFSTLTHLSSYLKPKGRRLFKRLRWTLLRNFLLWQPINTLFFRPSTFNAVRIHLPYAYANLSEVSRRRFSKDPSQLDELKNIFIHINDSVFRNQPNQFCKNLANYYRLMKTQKQNEPVHRSTENMLSMDLKNDLKRIENALEDNDIFQAYQILLRWGKTDIFEKLNDFELLGVSFLTARTESMVQGAEYLIRAEDMNDMLNDMRYRIQAIGHAINKCNAALLLDVIA